MKKVTIHHTLHGYSNGHRLLATSSDLDSDFKHELLKMSDSPGADFHNGENICYTGYPDESVGIYILSKTWRAKDSMRPGCVWTHSLLIPFSVFFDYKDFSFIKSLFLDEINSHNIDLAFKPIEVNNFENKHLNVNKNISNAFSYIFSSNEQSVLDVEVFTFDDLIKMWMKLWPNMRQSIKFRTWSPKIVPNDSYYKSYDILFGYNSNINIDSVNNWASELFSEGSGNCNNFLWEYGEKLDRKKSDVKQLVISYGLLKGNKFNELSLMILKWRNAPISLVRKICSLLSVNDLSKPVVYFISSYILILSKGDISVSILSSIGKYLFETDKDFFYKILKSESEHVRDISINVIGDIPIEMVAEFYNKGVYSDQDVINESIISNYLFWEKVTDTSTLFDNLLSNAHLSKLIPINSFSVTSSVTSKKDKLFRVLVNSFSFLNPSWLDYIEKNQCFFILNLTKSDFDNQSLSFFVLSKFNISTLSTLDDDRICVLYEKASKNQLILYKTLLILVDCSYTNYSQLLTKSFDDLCYFLSNNPLRFSEEAEIIDKIRRFGNPSFFEFNKLKYYFLCFSLDYSKRHNFPLTNLTRYKENLKYLKKIENEVNNINDDSSWF